jgi:hypothetical protein
LTKALKNSIRFVYNLGRFSEVSRYRLELRIFKPFVKIRLNLSLFLYKIFNIRVPMYLCDVFHFFGSRHDTRSRGVNLRLPRCSSVLYRFSFALAASKSGTHWIHPYGLLIHFTSLKNRFCFLIKQSRAIFYGVPVSIVSFFISSCTL